MCMRSRLLAAMGACALAAAMSVHAGSPAPTPPVVQAADPRMLELLRRQEQLEQEVRQLRGEVEQLNHELDGLKKRQKQLYLDTDGRLRKLELRATAPPQTEPATNAPAADSSPSEVPATDVSLPSADEREAYDLAFERLKQGRYESAIEEFASFLKKFPDSRYADNAQYWLGEASYVSRNYREAARQFQQVIDRYPDSPKVPDALLKLGYTQFELKQWQQARETLEEVQQRFPGSTAAKLAGGRLERLTREGH